MPTFSFAPVSSSDRSYNGAIGSQRPTAWRSARSPLKPHGGSRSARVWSCDLLRVGKGLNRPSAFSPLAAKKQHVVSAPGQEQSPPTNSQSSDSRGNLRAFALSRHRWGPRQGRDSPHYGGTVGKLRIGPKYPIQRLYVPCGAALKALRAGRTLRVLLLLIVQCSGCDRYLRLRDGLAQRETSCSHSRPPILPQPLQSGQWRSGFTV